VLDQEFARSDICELFDIFSTEGKKKSSFSSEMSAKVGKFFRGLDDDDDGDTLKQINSV